MVQRKAADHFGCFLNQGTGSPIQLVNHPIISTPLNLKLNGPRCILEKTMLMEARYFYESGTFIK